jgi:hypothetical protein
MVIATVFFLGSFAGICILFGIKYWEVTHRRPVAPEYRTKADERVLEFKELLMRVRLHALQLPPASLTLIRFLVHEIALMFARLASAMERTAHGVADFVSHKRGFERRTGREEHTKSEFLKRMGERRKEETLDEDENGRHNA